jgi:hypothetical protein
MINSTSSSDRTASTQPVPIPTPKAGTPAVGKDYFSAASTAGLRSALLAQPEIRPEVVARGKVLASDPSYPSGAILRKVGEAILNSPDPSEDGS